MRLWTIQPRDRWEELNARGVLRGPSEGELDFEHLAAYRWMAMQMARRLGPPPAGFVLPLWAWFRWQADRPRPDLRARGHLPIGSRGVRIELEIENSSVLLSDFEAWHAVLNRHYLATSEADFDAFEAGLELARRSGAGETGAIQRRMEASWERIFDLTAPGYCTARNPEIRPIQATLWQIRRDQVKGLTPFIAR